MADKKSSNQKRPKPGETARKIWLAGIGAYGRAYTEAQEAIKEITQDGSRMFDDLVQKGETIEASVQSKSKEFVERTRASTDEITDGIDERIRHMRSRLNRGPDDMADFDKRLTAIEKKLDRLVKMMGTAKPKAAPAKRTPPKKTAARKPAAKKPATRKPAAKK